LKSMASLVCFPQKGAGTKLTVKFPDVPVVRISQQRGRDI